MQVTSAKQHKVRYFVPLSLNLDRWAAWQLGLYCSTGSISCCYYVYCHSAYNNSVQPNTVHTGRPPHLQYSPDTKTSPTNLLSGFKFLLNPFIALCPTLPVTLLERHHQCWTKRNAELLQQPSQKKSYNRNNRTTGLKPELVHRLGPCRGTAATTATAGMVSPRQASTMLPNDIVHRRRHSSREHR